MYQLTAQVAHDAATTDSVGAAKTLNFTVYNSEGELLSSHPLTSHGDVSGVVNVDYQIEGDGSYMMDSPHNVTLDVFQVLTPGATEMDDDTYSIYGDAAPTLEFSSNTLYHATDFVGDGLQGMDVPVVTTGNISEIPLMLNHDVTALHEHSLQILGNGLYIDFGELEDISTKVKGVESIEVRGNNNSISIHLDDVVQFNDSHTLQILGTSSNEINVDLSGMGFKSMVTDGFVTYTNGEYSIIVAQNLHRDGIIL